MPQSLVLGKIHSIQPFRWANAAGFVIMKMKYPFHLHSLKKGRNFLICVGVCGYKISHRKDICLMEKRRLIQKDMFHRSRKQYSTVLLRRMRLHRLLAAQARAVFYLTTSRRKDVL